jgi:hypothetical protein
MRNYLLGLLLFVLFIFAVIKEPVDETIDALGGATNDAYGPSIDSVAGASYEDDDDDDEEDDD